MAAILGRKATVTTVDGDWVPLSKFDSISFKVFEPGSKPPKDTGGLFRSIPPFVSVMEFDAGPLTRGLAAANRNGRAFARSINEAARKAGRYAGQRGLPRDWSQPDAWHRGYLRGRLAVMRKQLRGTT